MPKLTREEVGEIRTDSWWKNKRRLSLDKAVIEESVLNLHLMNCPVCGGKLSREDSSGTRLHGDYNNPLSFVERYCPKDNFIVRLEAHQYIDGGCGTTLGMDISTNSKYSEIIADSGKLADIKNRHLSINYFE